MEVTEGENLRCTPALFRQRQDQVGMARLPQPVVPGIPEDVPRDTALASTSVLGFLGQRAYRFVHQTLVTARLITQHRSTSRAFGALFCCVSACLSKHNGSGPNAQVTIF